MLKIFKTVIKGCKCKILFFNKKDVFMKEEEIVEGDIFNFVEEKYDSFDVISPTQLDSISCRKCVKFSFLSLKLILISKCMVFKTIT